MIISQKSCIVFFYINGYIYFLAYLEYFITNFNFLIVYLSFIIRNYLLMFFIYNGTKHKTNINKIKKNRDIYSHIYVFLSTFIETLTHYFIKNKDSNYFLIRLLVFELIFDFFHYTFHRLLHTVPFLYKYIHKKHHRFNYPSIIDTYYHNPLDILLTNSLPTLIAFYFIQFSNFQTHLVLVYKSFIEISGHCGKNIYPVSSFPLCIWLPRYFNIELYTEDHDLHHSINNYNYAKRFSIWDKIFKTYKSGKK